MPAPLRGHAAATALLGALTGAGPTLVAAPATPALRLPMRRPRQIPSSTGSRAGGEAGRSAARGGGNVVP